MDTRKPARPLDPLRPSLDREPIEPFDPIDQGDVPEPSHRAEEHESAHDSKKRREPLNLDDLFDL